MTPDVHGLATLDLQPEVVLAVDVEGRHGRRCRDEDETADVVRAGLLGVEQVPACRDHLVEETLICGVRLDVVQRDPGTGLGDAPEHVVDGAAIVRRRRMVELRCLGDAGADEPALLGRIQRLRERREPGQLHQRMRIEIVVDAADLVGRELVRFFRPDAERFCLGRGHGSLSSTKPE
jgi:hypothetical protein